MDKLYFPGQSNILLMKDVSLQCHFIELSCMDVVFLKCIDGYTVSKCSDLNFTDNVQLSKIAHAGHRNLG